MLNLFVSFFPPFAKTISWQHLRDSIKILLRKKKKKISSRLQRFVFMVIQFWIKGFHL